MKQTLPTPTFPLEQIVYLRMPSDMIGMVIGYVIRLNKSLTYIVRWNDTQESEHMEGELTEDKEFRSTEDEA